MPGAVPLLGKAGDAYVFPHAIRHGLSPNHSGQGAQDHPLQLLPMFMRTYDFGTPYTALFERCTPRQCGVRLDRTIVMFDNNYS